MNIYHRYLAQYMLKNGVSTVDNAFTFCNRISQGKIENITQFKTLVIELNREISKQFYKIVFNTCEVTNEKIIVWLNTKNDDISKHQIAYSVLELEYFHAILQEILNSDNHRITFIVCINITSTLTSHLSRDNGQKVLNKWIKSGYYIKNGDFIYLGPRLILEFTSYLRSHCPNSICNLCSELVFTGRQCSHCNIMLHSYCLSKYLENQYNCPHCKNIWEISEEENENTEENTTMEVTQENGTEQYSTEEYSTEDGESMLTDEFPNSQLSTQRSTRSQRTRGSQQSQYNNHDEAGPSRRKYHK